MRTKEISAIVIPGVRTQHEEWFHVWNAEKMYRADETLYNTSKYFWILTPEKDYRYEIIAAYTTSVNSDTYTLFKGPGKEFLEYEKKCSRIRRSEQMPLQVKPM